ncbi:undecaprenyl-phosphate glucose phosphotransferase [Taklimakanibacter lacteus]|uniref:undecaprenyl-phosphate glucose phosphotransferase n=1 Tax=Taklimakanibacter lacteus TaxID=2268456 RepID=UPI000E668E43
MRNEKLYRHKIITSDFLAVLDRETLVEPVSEILKAPLISARIIAGIVRLGDFVLMSILGILILLGYVAPEHAISYAIYVPLILGAAAALVALLHIGGIYTIHALLRPADYVARLAGAWLIIAGLVIAYVFFSKAGDDYSRAWAALWFVGGLCSLLAFRILVSRLVRSWNAKGQLDRRAVLVGGGEPASSVIEALEASHDIDVSVIGIFDDRDDDRSPASIAGRPKLGNINELIDFVRRNRVDLLIVTLPLTAEARILQMLRQLWVLPVDIRLSAYTQKLRYRPRAYSYIGNVPFIDVFDKPLTDWGQLLKSIEDKIIAGLALVVLSPVMLAVALAIKLESRGPVFFRQHRYGFNNELIDVYKFRSMYTEMTDRTAAKLVTRDDLRVTRVGRFIRRTSLDELPQLLNVLKGELSLVGPRPHATHAKAQEHLYPDAVEGYFARHKVKPGITGWAQINGWRGETDTVEKLHRRVEHDLYYIENWSIAFDLYILLHTPLALVSTENAY